VKDSNNESFESKLQNDFRNTTKTIGVGMSELLNCFEDKNNINRNF
jgi:hypothetical protein